MLKNRCSFLLIILAITLWVSVGCSSTYEYKGFPLDPPISLPDFELMAANGSHSGSVS